MQRSSPASNDPASGDFPMRRIKQTPWRVDSISPTMPRTRFASRRFATNRYIVFQVLPHTLGVGPDVWRVLAHCHDLRNRGEYEGDLYIDERLVTDLIHACKIVAAALHELPPVR